MKRTSRFLCIGMLLMICLLPMTGIVTAAGGFFLGSLQDLPAGGLVNPGLRQTVSIAWPAEPGSGTTDSTGLIHSLQTASLPFSCMVPPQSGSYMTGYLSEAPAGGIALPGFQPAAPPEGLYLLPDDGSGTAIADAPVREVSEGSNRFAVNLYRQIRTGSSASAGNFFFSPFSISSALAIAGEGAGSQTAEEIWTVLCLPGDNETRRSGFYRLNTGISGAHAGYTLKAANALWVERTFPLLSPYSRVTRQYYGASASNLNFRGDPEGSRSTINQWVLGKTNGKIKDLLPSGSIDPLTRLVITNAVYFNGTWAAAFDPGETRDAPFTLPSGDTKTVRMMHGKDDAHFNYTETDRYQAVVLPYKGNPGDRILMLAILPKGSSLPEVEEALSSGMIGGILDDAVDRNVRVYLPKFRLETQYVLNDILADMGMASAFTPGSADFSGIDGSRDLYISLVVHKAYVDVSEKGTEAAAATAVAMKLTAIFGGDEVPVFRADHPFIFAIVDERTGSILFMGRVLDPGS